MTRRNKIFIAVGVVALIGTGAGIAYALARDDGAEVRLEAVEKRDLIAIVTASGNVRARRTVDMSSDVSARVAQLLVSEGDDVRAGQVLMRLDPTQFEAVVSRARAGLSQAQAQASQQEAAALRANRDYERVRALYQRDTLLVSPQQLQDLASTAEQARASLEGARFYVDQARASVEEAEDRLAKTIFRSPIDGKVTRLQVEEGETVIIGTMNNPGSLILTISDLGVVEVVVQVDETDVPSLALGDSAEVEIDAFPGEIFTGRVTEIGNSAIRPPSSQTSQPGQQAAIDFEVVITLDEPPVILRPDLSATADIVTDTRTGALAIPIIAMTVRPASDTLPENRGKGREGGGFSLFGWLPSSSPEPTTSAGRAGDDEVEGTFTVSDGVATFVPVRIGIAGDEYFEVIGGVQAGDTVAAGPYPVVRELSSGDRVRPLTDPEREPPR